MQLPQSALGPVKWTVRDHAGNLVVRGQAAPNGPLVLVNFTLPAEAVVPPDGSRYVLEATDGTSSCREYFQVVSADDLQVQHSSEIAYLKGQPLLDSLILPRKATGITVSGYLSDGTQLFAQQAVTEAPTRMGDAYVYRFTGPVVDTRTQTTLGNGVVQWSFLLDGATRPDQEMHVFYTITPYSATFIGSLKKLTDRAMLGDANRYLQITSSDLAHALLRGLDYVMQSPPLMTPFALDTMPITLRDFVVKAGAVDLLRSLYLAEGMSAFDMQGLGVQLNVDRTQYISTLVEELSTDLQGLPAVKGRWLEQGAPMGAQMGPGKRPIGHLALTTGAFSNFPQQPIPLVTVGAYNFLGGGFGFGPFR
jgi:hypothetical protein